METIKLDPNYIPKYKYIVTSPEGESETFDRWQEVVDYVVDGKQFIKDVQDYRRDYMSEMSGDREYAEECFNEFMYDELAESILEDNKYTVLKILK